MVESERPVCVHCKYFYLTWEIPDGRGCRAFGFKCEEYPSSVVYQVSGAECRLYERKTRPPKSPADPSKPKRP